jgi:hypothetical protein
MSSPAVTAVTSANGDPIPDVLVLGGLIQKGRP